ncbi:MAG: ABC transporter substrate-binding protein [Candidatus Omnitrophota bacterium]
MNPSLFLFLLIVSFLFILNSSIDAESASKNTISYGGALRWGTRNRPTIINPVLTTSSVSMSLLDLIFNRLIRFNSKGEIEPDLARTWEISEDGLTYTFYLKKSVKFHDGVECTAEDVKFTYDLIIDPGIDSPFKGHFGLVKDFKVIDRYTFRVILKEPSVSFIYRLMRDIAPKHILQNTDLRNNPFNHHPIGTGPFRFKEWGEDDTITLEYNPTYFEERPYLDNIIIKPYPNSTDVWTALMRGELDYVEFLERSDFEILKKDPSFKAFSFPVDYYYALSYNLEDPILSDKRIRQAIAYGIDRKRLIDRVSYGYGIECFGPFYEGSIGFNPDVKPFEYNPKKSLRLLNSAGWHDIDNDNILEKNGQELEIKVLVDSRGDVYKRIVLAIRQELQEIGIKVKAVFYDNENTLAKGFLEQNKPGAHIRLFLAVDTITIREYWSSKKSERVNNIWPYNNKEVDKLFESGEFTVGLEKRKDISQNIHKIIYEEQPACFLYFPFDFHAVSSKFENVDDFFNLNAPYYKMKDWYIKKEVFKYR